MASTTSDILIDSLYDWGVDTVFGLPGDGINGIMEALRLRQDKSGNWSERGLLYYDACGKNSC